MLAAACVSAPEPGPAVCHYVCSVSARPWWRRMPQHHLAVRPLAAQASQAGRPCAPHRWCAFTWQHVSAAWPLALQPGHRTSPCRVQVGSATLTGRPSSARWWPSRQHRCTDIDQLRRQAMHFGFACASQVRAFCTLKFGCRESLGAATSVGGGVGVNCRSSLSLYRGGGGTCRHRRRSFPTDRRHRCTRGDVC